MSGKIPLIGVLGVVLVTILVRQYGGALFTSNQDGTTTTPPQTNSTEESAKNDDGTTSRTTSSAISRWKRPDLVGPITNDPMFFESPIKVDETASEEINELPPGSPRPVDEFRVAGIVFNTEQPSSIIVDGFILHEGDQVHGATVTSIHEGYGILTRGEKTWTVRPGQSNREPE